MATAVILCLVSSACGTTLSPKERLALHGQQNGGLGGGGQNQGGASAPAGGASAPAGAAVGGGDPGASGGGGLTGGGAAQTAAGAPSGAASSGSGPSAAASKAPCAVPSNEVGVADSTITIGNVSLLSGPVPGIAENAVKGTQAYINMVNAKGGVCGRQVKLVVADDRSQAGVNASQHQQMMGRVLGFAGSFSVVDGGGASVLKGTKVPDISVGTDPSWSAVTSHYEAAPEFGAVTPQHAQYMASQGARTAAEVVVATAAARRTADLEKQDMDAAGIKTVLYQEISPTEFSFASAARAVANSKADVMLFLHTAAASASMARELQKDRYLPKFANYIVAYGSNFIDLAGSAAEGAATPLTFAPFEERASNPAVDTFLTWWDRTAPGLHPDRFAVDSWAATQLFFEAVAAAPGKITRDAILAHLAATGKWNASGLETTVDVGKRIPIGCFIMVRVRGGKWTREYPASGFAC